MTEIAFIGLGTMGRHMAGHLAAAGHGVRGHDRVAAAVAGVAAAASVAAAAAGAEAAITMLPDTPDVEAVVLGPGGLAESLEAGGLVVDMSTMSPAAAQRMQAALAGRGIGFVDAPVSGGPQGAEGASLTIMAGGAAADVERAMPLLRVLGRPVHVGGPGAGQTVKLCNQVAVVLNMQAVCETLALARAAGVDLGQVREVLLGGSAGSWVLDRMGPMMIADDPAAIFRIDLMLKDLRLVNEMAGALAVPLPATALATAQYLSARAHGEGGMGNQALYRVYDRMANQRQADVTGGRDEQGA